MGKKREEWVIEFASQKQILRIAEQTKHQFCLRFYPVHPFFPLFSISPSPSADWPQGLCAAGIVRPRQPPPLPHSRSHSTLHRSGLLLHLILLPYHHKPTMLIRTNNLIPLLQHIPTAIRAFLLRRLLP